MLLLLMLPLRLPGRALLPLLLRAAPALEVWRVAVLSRAASALLRR